jgi:ankyrin repeat protein
VPHFKVPLLVIAVTEHHDERKGSIDLLLNAGAILNALHPTPDGERTALMWSVLTCCDDVMQLLLERGADTSVRSTDLGMTALHLTSMQGTVCERYI